MVLALLVGLGALVGTGLVTYAVRENAGPLAGIVTVGESTQGTSNLPAGTQTGAVRTRKPGAGWKDTHELIANVILVLIGFHIAGVLIASVAHRENLIGAMITGRKRAESH